MNPRDWVEIEVAGMRFRTRRERTLLADSKIMKILSKDGSIGAHEIIKADCEIFSMETKQWRLVTDEDLEQIPRNEGIELLWNKINALRDEEINFRKTQPKKQNQKNGSTKTS